MIRNDDELAATRSRRAKLERLLEDLRAGARTDEWPSLSAGYRKELERMQAEILDYLLRARSRTESRPTAHFPEIGL